MLLFELKMPKRGSADGSWEGDGYRFLMAQEGDNGLEGHYQFQLHEGWAVTITATVVSEEDARKAVASAGGLKGPRRLHSKERDGFYDCGWMVDSILKHGRIEVDHFNHCYFTTWSGVVLFEEYVSPGG